MFGLIILLECAEGRAFPGIIMKLVWNSHCDRAPGPGERGQGLKIAKGR